MNKEFTAAFLIFLFTLSISVALSYAQGGTEIDVTFTVESENLSVRIVDYTTPINETEGMFLSSKINSTGTIDIHDVLLEWTLPDDWTLMTGELNLTFEVLEPGQIEWNNITVQVGAEGEKTVTAYGEFDTTSASDTRTIVVTSPNTTNDTIPDDETPPGDDSPPDDGPGDQGGIIEYRAVSEIDIYEGEDYTTTISVTNGGNSDLTNLHIKINGLDSDWYEIYPSSVSLLEPGESKTFTISIEPDSTGEYPFTVEIVSDQATQTHDVDLQVNKIQDQVMVCGNDVCDLTETCVSCPEDCGSCSDNEEPSRKLSGLMKYPIIIIGIIAGAGLAGYYVFFVLRAAKCPNCKSRLEGEEIRGHKFLVCPSCTFRQLKEEFESEK